MSFTRPLEPFDISILLADNDKLWVSTVCRQGTIHAVPRKLPAWPGFLGGETPSRWLTTAVLHGLRVEDESLELGRALGEVIFGLPDIAALFEQTRGVAAGEGSQVLVRIMAAPHEVAAWPWELILDPSDQNRYLAKSRDTHVVRSARTRTYPVRTRHLEPPLNLLLVMSNPRRRSNNDDEAVFDLYEEKRALLTELEPLVDRGLLRVVAEDRPTISRIRRAMGAERRGFHMLHFLGHARPEGLLLEDEIGNGQLTTSQQFSELLQQLPDLRLAVFAGCETATAPTGKDDTEWPPGLLSTTDYCVRDAAPAVVGMQAVLPFRTERIFTRAFYQAVTAGHSVSESMRLARLAISDDGQTGANPIDWSVPTLFVSGAAPGPLLDPEVKATSPDPVRRAVRRVGARQGERRFFARQEQLRTTIDLLSARNDARLLVVTGPSGSGKTKLLDRAIDELPPSTALLYIAADRLMPPAQSSSGDGTVGDGTADDDFGVERLCNLVVEVLKKAGVRAPARGRRGAMAWWEALLEDVTATPFALIVDDFDRLPPEGSVSRALELLVQRRGSARLAVSASTDRLSLMAALGLGQLQMIRLNHLSWRETWQWIRRNLPPLVERGEDMLMPFFSDLGPRLELWEQLAFELEGLKSPATPEVLTQIAAKLATTTREQGAAPTSTPVFSTTTTSAETIDSHEDGGEALEPSAEVAHSRPEPSPVRPLRVAVAGPFTDGRNTEFARSITQLAARHNVAGRAVDSTSGNSQSSLAELLPMGSPFSPEGGSDLATIAKWLGEVGKVEADIVVLDFGAPQENRAMEEIVGGLTAQGRLVIAAGGNSGEPCYPAWWPGVLAVGAADNGQPTSYSPYFADVRKPDLYAPSRLADSPMADTVADPQAEGTSFSAIWVAAAAVLVWSSYRSLPVEEVRYILVNSGEDPGSGRPSMLNLDAALAHTWELLLLDTLEAGRLTTGELLSASGLSSEVALPLLDELAEQEDEYRRIIKTTDGSSESFEYPKSVYAEYERLRRNTSGDDFDQLSDLMQNARYLAERRGFGLEDIELMWKQGTDAARIVALAAMQVDSTTLRFDHIFDHMIEAVQNPRSDFEQYQAMITAFYARHHMNDVQREQLAALVLPATNSLDDDIRGVAESLVANLVAELSGEPPPVESLDLF